MAQSAASLYDIGGPAFSRARHISKGIYVCPLSTVLTLWGLAVLGASSAHRLWAHRTYSAATPLRVFLMLCQCLVGQGPIYDWVLYHRLHHKLFGTDVDPYDHKKGFIYAHIMNRMKTLSPYQKKEKESIDMSDIEADPVVMLQKKFYYWLLYPVLFMLLPINAPLEYWQDSILSAIFVMGFLRYAMVLHTAWLIDSGVCLWGLQQGDKYPADTNMVFVITKSYWPLYHYLYPEDYKSGEYGSYDSGILTALIRVWAALGWAWDLRTTTTSTVQEALGEAARTHKSIPVCLKEAASRQNLPIDHYMCRG
ncbi:Acyl-CoA desaturase 1 [Eumeta japonica]|uniref:Acyl-CoA desaturase 1 n=1 Tax=Eumeta variegata TaxID=151549 RepID=A0A4C1XJU5_EUMVA|nr:Acyl-CoA desaturase 1 [Eumeta japonica]